MAGKKGVTHISPKERTKIEGYVQIGMKAPAIAADLAGNALLSIKNFAVGGIPALLRNGKRYPLIVLKSLNGIMRRKHPERAPP